MTQNKLNVNKGTCHLMLQRDLKVLDKTKALKDNEIWCIRLLIFL